MTPSSSGIGFGHRFTHSTHSARSLHWKIQYPATSSFASANGPSTTVGFDRPNFTRAPCELGLRPAPSRSTPALISSSLYLPIADSISTLGIAPDSDVLVALTRTMKRIVCLLYQATNDAGTDRQSLVSAEIHECVVH